MKSLTLFFSETALPIFIRFQASCRTIFQSGIDNLLKWFRTIVQEGCPVVKTLKNLVQNQKSFEAELGYIASGTQGLQILFS